MPLNCQADRELRRPTKILRHRENFCRSITHRDSHSTHCSSFQFSALTECQSPAHRTMIQNTIGHRLNPTSHSKVDMDTSRNLQLRPHQKVRYQMYAFLTSLGKVEKPNEYKPKNHTPSKVERRNTQKQIQKNKREEQIQQARFFGGSRGAAKIVVYIYCLVLFDLYLGRSASM